MTAGTAGCSGHQGLATELRTLAIVALDRLEPALDRIRSGDPVAGSTCAACPVCAVLAAVRGERPELAVRLADQAAGLVEVLRAALHEGAGETPRPPTPGAPAPGRPVQRIPVERR